MLLAVNALTPDDAATRREAVELLRARQCADGGWNFGNASVYDVDLRGYAQTTAMGLIALQQGHARVVARAFGFLAANWRLEPGGLTVAQALVAYRLHRRGGEVPELLAALGVDLAPALVSREAPRGRVGGARDRARTRAARAAEVARMSMTRKQLVVRTGAAALWVGRRCAPSSRIGWARSTSRRRFDRGEFPKPGRSSVAVLRAESYDGDLEAVVLDGLRLVEADVRRKSVLLKPNLVEFVKGASINTDPRMVVAAANALRRLGASSVVVAEGPGHRRDTEAIAFASGLRDALDDAGLRFVDLNDAPLVRTPLETRYTGLRELWVPRILRETEVVVSMPKLKTHHWVGVTMSLKNCFGCMPGRVYGWPKDVFHVRGIPESILDIFAAVRPSLAIVDGIVGMQGDGPIMGDPVNSGVVVVSRDPVAADVTGARLMGMDPEKVGT